MDRQPGGGGSARPAWNGLPSGDGDGGRADSARAPLTSHATRAGGAHSTRRRSPSSRKACGRLCGAEAARKGAGGGRGSTEGGLWGRGAGRRQLPSSPLGHGRQGVRVLAARGDGTSPPVPRGRYAVPPAPRIGRARTGGRGGPWCRGRRQPRRRLPGLTQGQARLEGGAPFRAPRRRRPALAREFGMAGASLLHVSAGGKAPRPARPPPFSLLPPAAPARLPPPPFPRGGGCGRRGAAPFRPAALTPSPGAPVPCFWPAGWEAAGGGRRGRRGKGGGAPSAAPLQLPPPPNGCAIAFFPDVAFGSPPPACLRDTPRPSKWLGGGAGLAARGAGIGGRRGGSPRRFRPAHILTDLRARNLNPPQNGCREAPSALRPCQTTPPRPLRRAVAVRNAHA